MKYAIIFHSGCFDGIASSAILLNFLRSQGGGFSNYQPIDYPINLKKWKLLKFNQPTAIVDFLYHPKAKIWFDHHSTAFTEKSWRKNFKSDYLHQWDPQNPSCSSLIAKHLRRAFNFNSPPYIKELIKWADIIDSAAYSSAQQAFNVKIPALQIVYSLNENRSLDFQKFLIDELSKKPLKRTVRSPRIQKLIKNLQMKFQTSMLFFKKHIIINKKAAFLDSTIRKNLIDPRFAPFLLYPKISYGIRLLKKGGSFSLSVSSNPWRRPKNPPHLGEFLRKHFGGGGHRCAAGAGFNTKKEAIKGVEKIINFLNKNG